MATNYTEAILNSMADVIAAAIDAGPAGGFVDIYDDSVAMPTDPSTITAALMGSFQLETTGFGAASGGVRTGSSFPKDTNVDNQQSQTPGFIGIRQSDVSAGEAHVVATVTWAPASGWITGWTVRLTALTITVANAA